MMQYEIYQGDIQKVAEILLPWEKLADKSILITGATGLIGSFLVDVLAYKNIHENLNCHIYALGRNKHTAFQRFNTYFHDDFFSFLKQDIIQPLELERKVDFIIHLASNTHPLAYINDPIGTITTNVIGTNNLLQFAAQRENIRFLFASSNEVYGENRGDVELFDESYCGYLNSNTLRAGYPESKRCGEALCQAYYCSRNVDFVIARLTRTFGPTMINGDSKVISQFIQNAIKNQAIILKSSGEQKYSFTYVADAVTGLLTVLMRGKKSEAYNVADKGSDISLKELANLVAELSNSTVSFELPNEIEKAGFSKATKAMLDGSKLKQLGWKANYSLEEGIKHTLDILKKANL
ncbi:MAG: NAD-dependent epimerase/dehydratase family protein [Liquorilactobacillus nagelii]|jgi:nucleoside-diphosphate-sugar epimerase|uniref:dTDP-glucose 4,6-dehydratase n=2 Tax=Lactobacillaceae TaxID=33958 RepID=A0A3S6QY45_9LACO|nr:MULTISPECIES: NAD-dependent epimerase/dehydratase family protein [Lactobacillales]AUJ33008.1 dTDP-glucose 4,6-dehydratase [Liquorilactobacillus nagelii]KRL42115.1 epimerase dehydratase [Liquorilactobacillus nagelii DSM 13675]MCC7616614.1 dTDP-glucose 4,6-dehydratase [Liquorilactobacillus nagelii]MCI1633851.1 NAD-dependent epimerase/dehydratase family protein [Liquorilactobacillus nagelii]MCI1700042.1 NAD-dependent epimerase/dehydratase family protein [Liquorilactobacillus nagelii]